MSAPKITPRQWLAAIVSTDNRPAVRAVATETLYDLARLHEIEARLRDLAFTGDGPRAQWAAQMIAIRR